LPNPALQFAIIAEKFSEPISIPFPAGQRFKLKETDFSGGK
jgi:hypothetical protein